MSAHPNEGRKETLLALLEERGQDNGTIADIGPDGLSVWLHCRQNDDFASGRTVVLNGWVLSRTECRLCALAVLT